MSVVSKVTFSDIAANSVFEYTCGSYGLKLSLLSLSTYNWIGEFDSSPAAFFITCTITESFPLNITSWLSTFNVFKLTLPSEVWSFSTILSAFSAFQSISILYFVSSEVNLLTL